MNQIDMVVELLDAIQFASEKHRNQRRKDAEATPYINHPVAVAHLLATVGGVRDLDVLRAAILHDTIEDTQTSAQELRDRFGTRVADIVVEVTDDKSLPKQRRKALQVEHAPHLSEGAALVKLADKTMNVRDIAAAPPVNWSIQRREEYFDWAKQVVKALPQVNVALFAAFDEAYQAGVHATPTRWGGDAPASAEREDDPLGAPTFAKTFETPVGQAVAMLRDNEGMPEIRWYLQPTGLGVCEFAQQFRDNDWDKADAVFSTLSSDDAAGAYQALALMVGDL